jgi:hypothetical protein
VALLVAEHLDLDGMSSARSTRRIPLPPPPLAALSMTGKPMVLAAAVASSVVPHDAPGTMGTPAAAIFARAAVFDPMARIALAGGPMKTTPAAAHASGSGGFSLRKPYPGWTASHPAFLATLTILSTRR